MFCHLGFKNNGKSKSRYSIDIKQLFILYKRITRIHTNNQPCSPLQVKQIMCGVVSFSTNYPKLGQLAIIGLSKLRSHFKDMQSVSSYSSQSHYDL